MSDNVISYIEMCRREGTSLQAGMNFGLGGNHSVILMSLRANAPYRDRLEEYGTILVYEGHDQPKGVACANPKAVDQRDHYPSGTLTQNGKFHEAAQRFKSDQRDPERGPRLRKDSSRYPVYGRTTAYFTWSIPGAKKTNSERSLNLDSSLLKVTRTSLFGREVIFNVGG